MYQTIIDPMTGNVANCIRRLSDGAVIPDSAANAAWREYQSWLAAGNQPSPYVSAAPTVDDVASERSRRLGLGFAYDFGDERGTHQIGTTEDDMTNWNKVTSAAQAAAVLGQGGTTMFGIVTNTGPATITALEWLHVLLAANAFEQPLFAASFGLQAMSPIPADFREDSHWTAAQ